MCEFMAKTLLMLEQMLLLDRIRLADIPIQIRMYSKRLYIAACRVDRNISKTRYSEDLQLLKNDLAVTSIDRSRQWNDLYLALENQMKYCIETRNHDVGMADLQI